MCINVFPLGSKIRKIFFDTVDTGGFEIFLKKKHDIFSADIYAFYDTHNTWETCLNIVDIIHY